MQLSYNGLKLYQRTLMGKRELNYSFSRVEMVEWFYLTRETENNN